MIFKRIIILFLIFLLQSSFLFAEYPDKTITIVVHSKPGSGIDIMARQLINIAAEYTDATLIVENKTGGSGSIAMRKVLSKKADGYYVLGVTKSFISTMLLADIGITVDDFDWLTCMVVDPEVLITNRHADVTTIEEIIQDAKEKKGKQRWVGPLVGGLDHLTAVKIWQNLGITAEWIPYEGGADALTALLGGHGVVYVGNPVDVRGRPDLKIAISATERRLEGYPDVPTFKEKDFDISGEVLWRGFALKKGTDPAAVKYLLNLFKKVSQDEKWINFIKASSAEPVFYESDQFSEMVKKDQDEAIKYLKIAGVLRETNATLPINQFSFLMLLIILFFVLFVVTRKYKKDWISGDTVIPATIIFISIYLYKLTIEFPTGKLAGSVGPASMPRLWIFTIILFSIWTILDSVLKNNKREERNGTIKKPLYLVGLMILFMLLVNYIGYYISVFIFLVAGMYLMQYRRHSIIFITTAGFVLFSYLAIAKVLQVPLPLGILFE